MPTVSAAMYRGKRCIVPDMDKFIQPETSNSSENWWEEKTETIKAWIKSNPLKIGIPDDGTTETITAQIARGQKFPETRIKCWSHIVRELQDLPGVSDNVASHQPPELPQDDVEPESTSPATEELSSTAAEEQASPEESLPGTTTIAESGSTSPSRGKIRPGKTVVPPAVSCEEEQRENSQSAKEEAPEPAPAPQLPKKKLSSMSMMERQAHWLEQKKVKEAAEKQRQEEEAVKELTFAPTLHRSTYNVTSRHKDSSAPVKKKPPPFKRAKSFNDQGTAAASSSSSRPKSREEPKRPVSGGGNASSTGDTVSRKSRKKSSSRQQPKSKEPSLLEAIKSELKAASSTTTTTTDTEEAAPAQASSEAIKIEEEAESQEEKVEEETEVAAEESEEVSPAKKSQIDIDAANLAEAEAFRYDVGSTDTKGRLKLREAAEYELGSMYRKRDKYAGRDGISLQMGRHETTHVEHVLAILFDRVKLTELDAGTWWVKNKHRFQETTE